MSKKILSSGVLPAPVALTADIEIANLDTNGDRTVTVEVFDWDGLFPVALPVTSFNGPLFIPGGGTVEIEETTEAFFTADLSATFFYEVRITLFKSEDVVANAFGLDAGGVPQEGDTVLHKDFRKVDID